MYMKVRKEGERKMIKQLPMPESDARIHGLWVDVLGENSEDDSDYWFYQLTLWFDSEDDVVFFGDPKNWNELLNCIDLEEDCYYAVEHDYRVVKTERVVASSSWKIDRAVDLYTKDYASHK